MLITKIVVSYVLAVVMSFLVHRTVCCSSGFQEKDMTCAMSSDECIWVYEAIIYTDRSGFFVLVAMLMDMVVDGMTFLQEENEGGEEEMAN